MFHKFGLDCNKSFKFELIIDNYGELIELEFMLVGWPNNEPFGRLFPLFIEEAAKQLLTLALLFALLLIPPNSDWLFWIVFWLFWLFIVWPPNEFDGLPKFIGLLTVVELAKLIWPKDGVGPLRTGFGTDKFDEPNPAKLLIVGVLANGLVCNGWNIVLLTVLTLWLNGKLFGGDTLVD